MLAVGLAAINIVGFENLKHYSGMGA